MIIPSQPDANLFVRCIGLAVGGTYGFAEGMRTTPANAPARIRINAILNAITRRGPYLGNTAGILAISYNIFNGIFGTSFFYFLFWRE